MTQKENKEINIEKMSLQERLTCIQQELNAPKTQLNKGFNYYYRNCEDIYNAVKPLLKKYDCTLYLTDELVLIGERYYIKATAILSTIGGSLQETITNTAFAREEESKSRMDGSQITGASSSYARKYALNGLFLIDDVKDSDTTNTEKKAKSVKNEEVLNGQFVSFLDDFIFHFPHKKESIFNKYNLKSIEDGKNLGQEEQDEIVSVAKRYIKQEGK